jgi:Fe-S oxidoreductase
VPIIRNPVATTSETEAVFYFPGCGSERLFSQVGLATQAMLWHAGVQTVLPPGYLCCGYPQRGSGQFDKAEKIITDNRVLFHRVANTLNYLDIKTVVVSAAAPATTSCRATSSRRSSPAAASSTSTSTCWRRASPCRAGRRPTCTTTPATAR